MPPTAAASPSSTGSSPVCAIATAMKSPPGGGGDPGWLVLLDAAGRRVFAFQQVPALAQPTWPAHDVPKQMHHDFRVPDIRELQRHRRRAEELGATLLYDRSDDSEPLYVLADPAGHPFCLLAGPGSEPRTSASGRDEGRRREPELDVLCAVHSPSAQLAVEAESAIGAPQHGHRRTGGIVLRPKGSCPRGT